MNKRELENELSFYWKESKIFMPNEIFKDLREGCKGGSSHIAFAYSFYYLISWLYRYCKYSTNSFTRGVLKHILRYRSTNKTMDYLIKKDGVLDQLGYTSTETDYPIFWSLDEFNDPVFQTYTEINDEINDEFKGYLKPNRRNQTIKRPLKAFFRHEAAEMDKYLNGTFYEVDNTHMIPFEVFIECMSNMELGCKAFYLYAFFSHFNDLYPQGYDISVDSISEETGIKSTTRDKCLDSMKRYNLIDCTPTDFVPNLPKELRKASRYRTNHFSSFTEEPLKYRKRNVFKLETVE